MLKKIADIFIAQKRKRDIAKTKSLVDSRIRQVDYGVLGRSLSCNPLMPRIFQNAKLANAKYIRNLHSLNNASKADSSKDSKQIAIIDTTLQKDISLVADARHYSPFLLIHKDIFISQYQVLESLVFGADCVALSPEILPMESLEFLQNYAYHLGLEVAILASKISHFENKANIFIVSKNLADSSQIPQNRLIITA